jgi:death on curing protein
VEQEYNALLEAALFRPQTGYYADVIEEATALWESLAQNHPFVDGNKRTAFVVTFGFLAVNGFDIIANPDETYAFIISIYENNSFTFAHLVSWLREHVKEQASDAN